MTVALARLATRLLSTGEFLKYFSDSTGTKWSLDINVGSVEKVKSACGVDLTKLFSNELELLTELFDNTSTLAEVLWVLCETPGTTKESFKSALKGDSLGLAANALVDDVIDFFPNPRRRELCRATVRKLWETVEQEQAKAESQLNSLNSTLSNSAGSLGE